MAKKQKSATAAAEKQLRAAVKKLQGQLAAAEKSAEKWKARAKEGRSVTAGVKSELAAVRRRLEKSELSVTKWRDRARKRAPVGAAPSGPAAATSPATSSASVSAGSVPSGDPDDSWTVTALRAEARRRGITGYSRKTKAALLAELRG